MLDFKNKKVLVVGLGLHGGGVGTVKFLAKEGAKITVTDLCSPKILKPSLKKLAGLKNIKYVLGKHRLEDFLEADLIIKGPGIKPDSEFIIQAKKQGVPTLNDIAIFLERCPAKIIGVTGSRGKSTTAFLIWKFLRGKYNTWLAGNIRKSVLELLPKIKAGDFIVLELSSFQLEDLANSNLKIKGKPEIAVLTNIFQEHLNWHKNFKDYLKAKNYITAFQTEKNYLFLNPDDKNLKNIAEKSVAKIFFPKLSENMRGVVNRNLGAHYLSSVALAVGVAKQLGITMDFMEKTLADFHGLPGRQEEIREIRGIRFINDTTSTMPESTVACVERFWKLKKKGAKIILITGGQDKNLDYGNLAEVIAQKAGVVVLLPGTATDKLKTKIVPTLSRTLDSVGGNLSISEAKSMPDAVKKAYAVANQGDYILLSPGAASFGLFLNEFDRGDKFVKAVKYIEKQSGEHK